MASKVRNTMIVHLTPMSAPAADQVISATPMDSAILALI